MDVQYMHPSEQLVLVMNRIYENGMTTTSGGNLSIFDNEGNIWITPASVDKGSLRPRDICCIKPDGTPVTDNLHAPSIEWPIHAGIYKERPDIKALVHAHPPSLVAFSCARIVPKLRLIDYVYTSLGKVALAPYALPGSLELGAKIAASFAEGYNLVLMENHGGMVGAINISEAFRRFEMLETLATIQINANKLGAPRALRNIQKLTSPPLSSFIPSSATPAECAARRDMVKLAHRAYKKDILSAAMGNISFRLDENSFLITPKSKDRNHLTEDDIVLVRNMHAEEHKTPSFGVWLHKAIFDTHPDVNAIMSACPPHAMAFAITEAEFDTRTIPESYIYLRQVQRVAWERLLGDPQEIAKLISPVTPVLMLENSQILATGDTLIRAFDRVEVAEATARSIIATKSIGDITHISEHEVEEINTAFRLPR
ncbi:MAG: class II aldolase/adducin family protein [Defluviitaleaceae bacterium]|nr:class II aldolase/adducin family protein [Defluviitaleaceae bacterium]